MEESFSTVQVPEMRCWWIGVRRRSLASPKETAGTSVALSDSQHQVSVLAALQITKTQEWVCLKIGYSRKWCGLSSLFFHETLWTQLWYRQGQEQRRQGCWSDQRIYIYIYTSVDQDQHTSFITNVAIGQHAEFREINYSYRILCVLICVSCIDIIYEIDI